MIINMKFKGKNTLLKKISAMKVKESARGITMLALTITIIILLILAGITITALTGENRVNIKFEKS